MTNFKISLAIYFCIAIAVMPLAFFLLNNVK